MGVLPGALDPRFPEDEAGSCGATGLHGWWDPVALAGLNWRAHSGLLSFPCSSAVLHCAVLGLLRAMPQVSWCFLSYNSVVFFRIRGHRLSPEGSWPAELQDAVPVPPLQALVLTRVDGKPSPYERGF